MSLDYGLSEGEFAMEVALIAGAFAVHPRIARGCELIALLTSRQQAIYWRMKKSDA